MKANKNELYFKQELSNLSGRARNFLGDLKLDKYSLFYRKVIQNQKIFFFRDMRNCGEITEAELLKFVDKISSVSRLE